MIIQIDNLETPTPTPESFVKEEKKSCKSNDYGFSSSMEKAKAKCSKDPRCIGVYDQGCDGIKNFGLCPREHELESSSSACVYLEGRYFQAGARIFLQTRVNILLDTSMFLYLLMKIYRTICSHRQRMVSIGL